MRTIVEFLERKTFLAQTASEASKALEALEELMKWSPEKNCRAFSRMAVTNGY